MRLADMNVVRQQWLDVQPRKRLATQRPTSWRLDILVIILTGVLPTAHDLVFCSFLCYIGCWLYIWVVRSTIKDFESRLSQNS